MEEKRAHIVVDVQPDFMQGGPLPVPGGYDVIKPNNEIIAVYADLGHLTLTTQDFHPEVTAHFSVDPNYNTTWPPHCVAGTPGAALHRDLKPAPTTKRFVKGDVELRRTADDRSYSGYFAHEPGGKLTVPEYLRQHNVRKVSVGGLATDYCVGKTVLDLALGDFEVTFVSDASRAIDPVTEAAMLDQFRRRGIRIMTTAALLAEVKR